MTAIPIPLSTSPGEHPQESAGRLINCFAEPLGQGARAPARWRRAPGLSSFATSSRTGCRGIVEINGVLYAAFSGQLEKWTSAGGASTNVAALTGTSKVFFFRNNKTPTPDQFVVDPDNGASVFTSSSVSAYPDLDLPAVNGGCAYDGYGIFTTGAGQIWATDLNSTAVNALSFAKAESNPDGLLRPIPWASRLFAFGTRTIEVWINAGTTPFPLERVTIIPRGLGGRYAVAGHEDDFTRALAFVGNDNAVYVLNGYEVEKVSPPDLDRLIEAVTDKNTLEACVYIANGHAFWQLSSATWTWVFNFNSNVWHERASYLSTRSRITTSYYAFNKWLVGDTLSGNIMRINPNNHFEIDKPFRMRIETGPVDQFPHRTRVARADFDVTTGVGRAVGSRQVNITNAVAGTGTVIRLTVDEDAFIHDGDAALVAGVLGTTEANGTWTVHVINSATIELIGSTFVHAYTSGGTLTNRSPLDPIETDPQIEISWSDDGGVSWGNPVLRSLGRQALAEQQVTVRRAGMTTQKGRRWRLDISDPIPASIMRGDQSQELRR